MRLFRNMRRFQGLFAFLFFQIALINYAIWRFGTNNIHAYAEYTRSFGTFCLVQAALVLLTGGTSCAAANETGRLWFVSIIAGADLICWSMHVLKQWPYLISLERDGWLPARTASALRGLLAINLGAAALCAAILLLRVALARRKRKAEPGHHEAVLPLDQENTPF